MNYFGPEVFSEVKDVANSYYEVARHNIDILKTNGLKQHFRSADTSVMLSVLSRQTDAGAKYCWLGELAESGQFDAGMMFDIFGIHTEIQSMNAHVDQLRRSKEEDKSIPAEFVARLDIVLVRSRALVESMIHAARVANDEDVFAVVMKRGGYGREENPLTPEREAAGVERLKNMHEEYKAALKSMSLEVAEQSFDRMNLAKRVPSTRFFGFPTWTVIDAHEGARVMNDVWMPKEAAEPLLKQMQEQKAVIVPGRPGVSPKPSSRSELNHALN